jgi:hypothetical protein
MYLVTTLADNSSTSYDDAKADAALGPQAPSTNTAYVSTAVHLTAIPRGTGVDAVVQYRKLYRRSGGAGLRLLATINDNTSTTYDDTIANAALGAAPPASNTAALRQIPLTGIPFGSALVTSRKVYRTPAGGGSTFKLLVTINDNSAVSTFTDNVPDSGLGAVAPTINTAYAQQVQLAGIPVGPATVTTRKVYRTAAGAAQLRLLKILADNTTTSWLDSAADATLGANVPTSDTSGLTQPQGNVLAGSTSLPCASVAQFRPAGGWVLAGSQPVRYTGISGNNLTGIPAAGPGSLTATITYNATVLAAPLLLGIPTAGAVGAILYTVLKGDPVNVFVQEDDLTAQAAVRVQLPGSDGVIEDEIQDRRLSETEGRARARARLDLLADLDSTGKVGVVTVHYVCRDTNTRAGRTVRINLGPPVNLSGDFLIQRVTESTFYVPHLPPTFVVEASSLRFSFEELLRIITDAGA